MMKYFKQLALIFLIFGSPFTKPAMASTHGAFASDGRDMLRGSEGDGENENADQASRWGTSANKMHAENIPVAKPLHAIDDSSFASEPNRAPSSTRDPATVNTVKVAKKPLPSVKTMIRTLKQKKAYQEAAVIVNDLGFFPSMLFFTQGIPVRLYITGASQRSQCMILDAFGIRRQVRSQKVEEVVFTPDEAGKFNFTCPMNGAKGTMIVKELQITDRLPASEPVTTSMAKPVAEEAEKDDHESIINDSDFGTEFRLK